MAVFSNSDSCERPDSGLPRLGVQFFVVIWLIAALSGMLALVEYGNQSAPASRSVETWPSDSQLTPGPGDAMLLVFLHPKCACSVATIRQLATICSQAQFSGSMKAIFCCPHSKTFDWAHTDLWHRCARLPGMTCVVDVEGREASLFGVSSSGHLLLFDATQKRLFDGGITFARAHEGSSAGSESLTALLKGLRPQRTSFPVFGCQLHDDSPAQFVAVGSES